MPELADIVHRYGGAYRARFGEAILPSHRRALSDIAACRTEALGGQVFRCDTCGREEYAYHSCRNRHCPKCHTRDIKTWLVKRRAELLAVPYFHVVFTVPAQLHDLMRRQQRLLYGLLMKAAASALIKLTADPHYVGGLIGVLAVLHTWTRTLTYHPHVHCLVPAGGLSPDGNWLPARLSYLVPVRALSKIFRGIFRDLVRKHLPHAPIPRTVWRKPWCVYCKPSVAGVDNVLTYLARYVHRIAITNRRILSIDGGHVTFRYQDARDQRWATLTLPSQEFLRCFLQHVLPDGFHKVRYYGLWAPANRHRLRHCQSLLGPVTPPAENPVSEPPIDWPLGDAAEPRRGRTCRHCRKGILVCVGSIPRQQRGPP